MKRLVILSILLASACTTVANGPMQRVVVDSNPSGASVRLSRCGAMATKTAVTPAVVWVSRRSTQCRLTLSKPNYAEQKIRLTRHVTKNLSLYGTTFDTMCEGSDGEICAITAALMLPSFAVDAVTGSMFQLEPNEVFLNLAEAEEEWRGGKKP